MFLVIQSQKQLEMQLKVEYFQIDNNISEKALFPVILYPKELLKRKERLKKEKIQRFSSREKKEESKVREEGKEQKEFFNLYLSMRNEFKKVLFIEKIEFLVQTMVLQMDDELIGFIFKFTNCIYGELNTNITGLHEVFKIMNDQDVVDASFMLETENNSPRRTFRIEDMIMENQSLKLREINEVRFDQEQQMSKT